MSERRLERQRQQYREALERALDVVEREGFEGLDLPVLGESTGARALISRLPDPEALFFHDHAEILKGLQEALGHFSVLEALLAYGEHLETDRELWLRRLQAVRAVPRLRARKAFLDEALHGVLAAHFRRWGAADPAGLRASELEAHAVLGALNGALALWVEGGGRPTLPVLLHEGMVLLWPALYPHQRRK